MYCLISVPFYSSEQRSLLCDREQLYDKILVFVWEKISGCNFNRCDARQTHDDDSYYFCLLFPTDAQWRIFFFVLIKFNWCFEQFVILELYLCNITSLQICVRGWSTRGLRWQKTFFYSFCTQWIRLIKGHYFWEPLVFSYIWESLLLVILYTILIKQMIIDVTINRDYPLSVLLWLYHADKVYHFVKLILKCIYSWYGSLITIYFLLTVINVLSLEMIMTNSNTY